MALARHCSSPSPPRSARLVVVFQSVRNHRSCNRSVACSPTSSRPRIASPAGVLFLFPLSSAWTSRRRHVRPASVVFFARLSFPPTSSRSASPSPSFLGLPTREQGGSSSPARIRLARARPSPSSRRSSAARPSIRRLPVSRWVRQVRSSRRALEGRLPARPLPRPVRSEDRRTAGNNPFPHCCDRCG